MLACDTQSSIYLSIYIQAEKERLLYDMQQRRGLEEDGERNAIRRGLRAGPSHDTSEATSLQSSLPPSLPPGPPSSTSSGSSTSVALCLSGTNWEAVARLWHARNPGWGCSAVAQTALAVPATAKASSTQGEELAPKELTAAEALADMATEEDATVAHQSGCATSHSATQGELQAIPSRPKHGTVASPVKVIREFLPPAPDESNATRNVTPAQALDLARHQIRSARTMPTYSEPVLCANGLSECQSADAETEAVIRTLAHSLGAVRTEAGTVKSLHSVLLQLVTPGMTQQEACKLTGAALSSHSKWRNKVLKVGTMRNGEVGLRRWSSPVPSMDQAAPYEADQQLSVDTLTRLDRCA